MLKSKEIGESIANAKQYLARLAADGADSSLFVNGVALPMTDEWLQLMSQRISMDLRSIQKGVFEDKFNEGSWLPQHFLSSAAVRRNPLLIPENEKNITLINMAEFQEKHGEIYSRFPEFQS